MKLIACYIENFGCLHAFSFNFEEELTTIYEENGWGKSTFAAFIRAMFYGLEPLKNRKNLEDRERDKYKPWQGGTLGGSITIQVADKKYRVERFFGKKESEDTFMLYNLETGKESTDFTSAIGEELFKIDRDAYAKSAYIPQKVVEIGTNDTMNAKLGNLIDSDNDINRFESAISALDEARKVYQKSGGQGKIDLAKTKITQLESEIKQCEAKANALSKWKEKYDDFKKEEDRLRKRREEIQQEVNSAIKYDRLKQNKDRYIENIEKKKQLAQEIEAMEGLFLNGMPTLEELETIEHTFSQYYQAKGEKDAFLLITEEKNILNKYTEWIALGHISKEQVEAKIRQINALKEYSIRKEARKMGEEEKEKMQRLAEFFGKKIPTQEEVETIFSYLPILRNMNEKLTKEEIIKEQWQLQQMAVMKKPKKATFAIISIVISLCLLIGAIILQLVAKTPIGIVIGGVSILLFIVGILNLKKRKKQGKERENTTFVDSEEVEKVREQKTRLDGIIRTFIQRYLPVEEQSDYTMDLITIKEKRIEYNSLLERAQEEGNNLQSKMQEDNKAAVYSFLLSLGMDVQNTISQIEEGMQKIKQEYELYESIWKKNQTFIQKENICNQKKAFLEEKLQVKENLQEEFQIVKERIARIKALQIALSECISLEETFKAAADFKEWVNLEERQNTVADFREMEKLLEEKIENIRKEEEEVKEKMNELFPEVERIKEFEQELWDMQQVVVEGTRKLKIIKKTMELLKEAKDGFSSHYMKGMRLAFLKYINLLAGEQFGQPQVDTQMKVKIQKAGALRDLDYFSAGNKDLIGICARFALIDALFETEKPFVVLDDPFVNLDGKKLQEALSLLNEIAKKYQVIYFVCHESRVVSTR